MLKKRMTMLMVLLALTLLPTAAFGYDTIEESPLPLTVSADGLYVPTDVDPYIERGRTLMPLRAGATAVGAQVQWHSQSKKAVITKGSTKLVFTLNQKHFTKNGKRLALDVPLKVKKGRIMLPLRAFAEALDVEVDWDRFTATVFVTTGEPMAAPPDKSQFPKTVHWLIDKYYTADTSDGKLLGSWWDTYTQADYTNAVVDENAQYYTWIFFYQVADQYRGVIMDHTDYDVTNPNSVKSTIVSELVPTTNGMNHIPKTDREALFQVDWSSLYAKTYPTGLEGLHTLNFKAVDQNQICNTHRFSIYGAHDQEVVYNGTYYSRF